MARDGSPRMLRKNRTCDACISKKRRCGRQRPACESCVSTGTTCFYRPYRRSPKRPPSAAGPETTCPNSPQHSDGSDSGSEGDVRISDSAALDVFLDRIAPHLLFMEPTLLRSSLSASPLARAAAAALASSVSRAQTPQRIAALFQQALALVGPAALKPEPADVIALILLLLATLVRNDFEQLARLTSLAWLLSVDIGLNAETRIAALAPSDPARRSALRGILWSVYQLHIFQISAIGRPRMFPENFINIRLPSDSYPSLANAISFSFSQTTTNLFASPSPSDANSPTSPTSPNENQDATFSLASPDLSDPKAKLEIAAMSETSWSIPAVQNCGTLAAMLLIQKIIARITLLHNSIIDHTIDARSAIRAQASLNKSLRDWIAALPQSILTAPSHLASSSKPPKSITAWRPVFVLSLYHTAIILLNRHAFANVVHSSESTAVSYPCVAESIAAANKIAEIAFPIIRHDAYAIVSPFIHFSVFQAVACLIVAVKLPAPADDTTRNARSLATLMQLAHSLSTTWKANRSEVNILEHLAKLPDAASVIHLYESIRFPKKLSATGLKIGDVIITDQPADLAEFCRSMKDQMQCEPERGRTKSKSRKTDDHEVFVKSEETQPQNQPHAAAGAFVPTIHPQSMPQPLDTTQEIDFHLDQLLMHNRFSTTIDAETLLSAIMPPPNLPQQMFMMPEFNIQPQATFGASDLNFVLDPMSGFGEDDLIHRLL